MENCLHRIHRIEPGTNFELGTSFEPGTNFELGTSFEPGTKLLTASFVE